MKYIHKCNPMARAQTRPGFDILGDLPHDVENSGEEIRCVFDDI